MCSTTVHRLQHVRKKVRHVGQRQVTEAHVDLVNCYHADFDVGGVHNNNNWLWLRQLLRHEKLEWLRSVICLDDCYDCCCTPSGPHRYYKNVFRNASRPHRYYSIHKRFSQSLMTLIVTTQTFFATLRDTHRDYTNFASPQNTHRYYCTGQKRFLKFKF